MVRVPFSAVHSGENQRVFANWAAWKKDQPPPDAAALLVEIENIHAPAQAELDRVRARCLRYNMALIETGAPADKAGVRAFGRALGLERLDRNLCADGDGVTSLRVAGAGQRGEYIPYSNQPLNWHTDGYYNDLHHQIGAFILYCVQNAAEGGENAVLDPEWIYLRMREREPAWVEALHAPDAMTIPANVKDGRLLRPEQTGPVFLVSERHGSLHMRYTARKRHVEWKNDTATREAAAWLEETMNGDVAPVVRLKLKPGQGLVSNNVLHNRAGFSDAPGRERVVYRARYYDRVAGAGLADLPPNALTP